MTTKTAIAVARIAGIVTPVKRVKMTIPLIVNNIWRNKMEKLIEILTWLDESNVAYLLMIGFFIGMYKLHDDVIKENKRLRRLLRNAVLED